MEVEAGAERRVQSVLEYVPSFCGVCDAGVDIGEHIPGDQDSGAGTCMEMGVYWSSWGVGNGGSCIRSFGLDSLSCTKNQSNCILPLYVINWSRFHFGFSISLA